MVRCCLVGLNPTATTCLPRQSICKILNMQHIEVMHCNNNNGNMYDFSYLLYDVNLVLSITVFLLGMIF